MTQHVLIVEDTFQVRHLIEKLVRHLYPEAEVVGVPDGRAAVQHAIRKQPDLIITDLEMPEFDGYDLMISLKSLTDTAHIPFIVVTSHADRAHDRRVTRELENRGLEIVPVMSKPLEISAFCEVIELSLSGDTATAV